MTQEELINLDISGKSVLIIGCPASGKTWLANKMKKDTHELIHTDNYIKEGFSLGCYAALTAVSFATKPTIVEGVQGYRMLRKGVEYASYLPDIVVNMTISAERMSETYSKERDANKIKHLIKFNDANAKILNEYKKSQLSYALPVWIDFYNNY